MSLVLLEGFDHYSGAFGFPADQMGDKGWSGQPFGNGPGRLPYGSQSQCINVINNNGVSKSLPYTLNSFIMGCAFKFDQAGFPNGTFASLSGGGSAGVGVNASTGYMFVNVSGTGTLTGTGTHQISVGQWHYVELKVTPTTAEVYLDGILDITAISGTYTGSYQYIAFSDQRLGGGSMQIDDVYVIDPTTGATNTNYLGDICVETLFPISDGTYTQWTPNAGSNHYSRVDEHILDDDVTYVATTGAGNKDSYNIGDPVLASTPVFGVQLNLAAKKNDAGVRTIAPLIRQSGVDHIGTTTAATLQYIFHSQIYDQDPTGTNWTYTTVNADEYGIELVS